MSRSVVAILLCAIPVIAQQEPTQDPAPHRLGEITVTATRTAESYLDVPQSVTIANFEETGRRQPSSAALLLREEPGVWVQRTGASGGSPIVRGQIGNRVLYLWDGVRVNNGALFGGPNGFLNQIQPGSIDRIEVLRGPGSVQYGSDAIGGVVHVMTRRVTDYPEEGVHYGGSNTVRYGSVDDLVSNDTWAWASGHRLSLLAGGGFQDFKDYEGGEGFGRVDNTNLETHGFYVKAGWKPSEHHLVELSVQEFDHDDVHNYIQSKTNASGIPTLLTPNTERDLAKLSYEGRDLSSWLSSLDGYAYAQQFDSFSERVTENATRFDNRQTTADQSIYGTGFQGVTPVGVAREHRLVWGGDYRREKLGSSVDIVRTTKATGAVSVFEPQGNTPDGLYEVWDAFARIDISLHENLTISPGVRYEVTHLGANPRPIDLVAPFTLEDIDLNKWWQSLTWSVGGMWWLTEELGLAADVATGFRAPTYSDALSFSVPVFSTQTASIPSPGVEPEEAIQYEFGPRYASDHVTVTLTGYYVDLDPLIVSVPAGTITVPGVGVRQAQESASEGRGFIKGVELGVEVCPIEGLTLFGSLTYAWGKDQFRDAPLRFIPPLNGNIGARYEAQGIHPWWIEANVRLVDRYTRHAPDDERDAGFATDPGFGSPNTTTNRPLRADFDLPGYVVVYLRGGVELFRRGNLAGNLTVTVENLLDTKYRETFSRQVVEPGANVVTALELSF